jgi:hypothetical protein
MPGDGADRRAASSLGNGAGEPAVPVSWTGPLASTTMRPSETEHLWQYLPA